MNKNSNTYIITYATIMVLAVALLLSYTALSLKSRQQANVRMEKMGDILASIGEGKEADQAPDKLAYITEQYDKYIVGSYAVNAAGEIVGQGEEAFELSLNLKEQYDKPMDQRILPIFESRSDDGTVRYIVPLWGVGLWGPIWGNVALESDFNTIYGVVLDHEGETPGLGAEIAAPDFTGQFKNKEIYRNGKLNGISVLKGKGSSEGNVHAVDAVSGGTITSRGVEEMILASLSNYEAFFEKLKTASPLPSAKQEAPEKEAEHADDNHVNTEEEL